MGWVDREGNPENAGPGPGFHSLIAPAVGEALTGEIAESLPVAAAVELLHNLALVHGDVQAGRVDAQARPSIWWLWGPGQAINAGDGFHALGRVAVMRLLDRGVAADRVLAITEMLDRACLAMCEGQFSDLGFQDRLLVTDAEYDDMIARKTGALTGCAAAGAALASGADNSGRDRFQELGVKLGMAWQITQDLTDFRGPDGDGVTAGNLLNKKKSLPMIIAMEQGSTAAKRELGSIYMKRVLEPPDVARVLDIMNETGAPAQASARAAELVNQALDLLPTEDLPAARQTGIRALAELIPAPQR